MRLPRSLLAAAVAAALSTASAAAPAPPTATSADETGPEAAQQLDDVLVTANRIEQPIEETPMAVTALDAKALDRLRVERFDDYLTQVPAMASISPRPGATQLILRGISAGAQANSMVSIYVDDSPFGSSSIFARAGVLTADFDPYDMARIEVLRGPQGTLYGANSLGGVLKFVTVPPVLGQFETQVQGQYTAVSGGDSGWGARALANVPLGETAALRANVYKRRDPGYIDDVGIGREDINGSDVAGGRVSLLWQPSDALQMRLTSMGQNLDSVGAPVVELGADRRPLYGDYTQRRWLFEDFGVQMRQHNLAVQYDFDATSLLSSTSYGTQRNAFKEDRTLLWRELLGGALGAPFDSFAFTEEYGMRQKKFTQELRAWSRGEHVLNWQTGLYYSNEETGNEQALYAYDPTTRTRLDMPALVGDELFIATLPATYDERAAFGTVTWTVSPTFDVALGARYGSNEQRFTQNTRGALLSGVSSKDSDDASWTYLLNPRWRPNDDLMLYGRIATGYRPGGPNFVPPPELAGEVPGSFQPDELVSYEFGFKGEWLDRRVGIDAAAFYIDWSDVQLNVAFNGFGFRGNGGSARSQGVETALRLRPAEGLALSLTGAYTDAKLTQDVVGGIGRNNDRLPYVPKFSGALNADYERRLSGALTGFVGASYRHIGTRASGFGADGQGLALAAYNVADLRAGIETTRWNLTLSLKNAANADDYVTVDESGTLPGGGTVYSAAVLQPRTIGLTFTGYF